MRIERLKEVKKQLIIISFVLFQVDDAAVTPVTQRSSRSLKRDSVAATAAASPAATAMKNWLLTSDGTAKPKQVKDTDKEKETPKEKEKPADTPDNVFRRSPRKKGPAAPPSIAPSNSSSIEVLEVEDGATKKTVESEEPAEKPTSPKKSKEGGAPKSPEKPTRTSPRKVAAVTPVEEAAPSTPKKTDKKSTPVTRRALRSADADKDKDSDVEGLQLPLMEEVGKVIVINCFNDK